MDDKTLKALLGAQQGELDAVLMYQNIAKKIKNEEIKALLLDSAKDEGRHASVFHKITKVDLKPKRTLAILVPILMTILGKKLVFRVIAKSEYGVKGSYEKLIPEFPEVADVLKDEFKHGDRMMELSNKF